ncbi:asialoglycoprotein receptor 1-like [Melanotaenia boesemani]|uniref:asialoglycoprotein receptor 1-like n=1 Tax=Melanotaenia boesemani TaxID=1250792 RepID=UPI001C03AE2A|nr:asialoglycoprotein receptor 1-like [Melanotaenia boesemani]
MHVWLIHTCSILSLPLQGIKEESNKEKSITSNAVMQENGDLQYKKFGLGECSFPNYKVVILCLGVLNAVLFIAAVVLAVNCAKVKHGLPQDSHSAALQLISELDDLRSNHSDVITAEAEAKSALDGAIKNYTRLKENIEKQKIINDGYQRQIAGLRAEKQSLQSNVSALEGSCGRCQSGWVPFSSSCYLFSYTESTTLNKNWLESRVDCKRRGSDLIVIDNKEEQRFVSSTIDNMRAGRDIWQQGFWIGLSDTDSEGTWVWINNVTEVEQRYWMDGEPNEWGRHGEDCGVAVYSDHNPWKTRFDDNCLRSEKKWICEMRAN